MWEYIGAFGVVTGNDPQIAQDLLASRPGGIIRVKSPNDVQFLPRAERVSDCKGCGAPLKAYIHHCEYCRRTK